MKGYLLDTNICIFAMRDKYGVNERLERISPQQCHIADVTVTDNISHLSQIKGLKVENWIQR